LAGSSAGEGRRVGSVTCPTLPPTTDTRPPHTAPRLAGVSVTSPERPAETTTKRVLLAAPRGYCAGVDRAVVAVEKALETYGTPVYVRKEIVHNKHVVETLRERGAIFVNETDEVPEGARLVFSAHGVSPAVRASAQARSLETIDATCPLVTKVHRSEERRGGTQARST